MKTTDEKRICEMKLTDCIETKKIASQMGNEWFLYKHYARIKPSVILSLYGLFYNGVLSGVCSFSPPPRMFNSGTNLFNDFSIPVMELSRVVIDDNLPKNSLSFFISQVMKLLPTPIAIISYADENAGHHGYIYQAMNWMYLGKSGERRRFVNESGKQVHERTIQHQRANPQSVTITTQDGKHRYLLLVGDKRERRVARNALAYKTMAYPKGNNTRYDSAYNPGAQMVLL